MTVEIFKIDEWEAGERPKILEGPDGSFHQGKFVQDGYVYQAVAIRWRDHTSFGDLGCVDEGWLVVLSWNGQAHLVKRSYLLRNTGYIDEEYIARHFDLKSEKDIKNFTWLIRSLPERTEGNAEYEKEKVVWDGVCKNCNISLDHPLDPDSITCPRCYTTYNSRTGEIEE